MAATSDDDRRRAWDGFDARPASAGSGADPAAAVVRRLGGDEGEAITDRPGRRLTLLAETDELAVTETVYGPGERGPDLHVHHHHTDVWLVLDGTLTFETRDEITFTAGAGTLVVVPPDVAHGFRNAGDAPARYINIHAPSCGFGDYLRGTVPRLRSARPSAGRRRRPGRDPRACDHVDDSSRLRIAASASASWSCGAA